MFMELSLDRRKSGRNKATNDWAREKNGRTRDRKTEEEKNGEKECICNFFVSSAWNDTRESHSMCPKEENFHLTYLFSIGKKCNMALQSTHVFCHRLLSYSEYRTHTRTSSLFRYYSRPVHGASLPMPLVAGKVYFNFLKQSHVSLWGRENTSASALKKKSSTKKSVINHDLIAGDVLMSMFIRQHSDWHNTADTITSLPR